MSGTVSIHYTRNNHAYYSGLYRKICVLFSQRSLCSLLRGNTQVLAQKTVSLLREVDLNKRTVTKHSYILL